MRIAVIAASLLTLVGLLAAVPASGGGQRPAVQFRLSGSVGGLYPGARRLMNVKIHNPYRRSIRVVSVTAKVQRAARFCSAANLDVRPYRGRLVIPRRRAGIVRMLVAMQPTAAQECSGSRFPLVFSARAVGR